VVIVEFDRDPALGVLSLEAPQQRMTIAHTIVVSSTTSVAILSAWQEINRLRLLDYDPVERCVDFPE
jgi:hypothetical protein